MAPNYQRPRLDLSVSRHTTKSSALWQTSTSRKKPLHASKPKSSKSPSSVSNYAVLEQHKMLYQGKSSAVCDLALLALKGAKTAPGELTAHGQQPHMNVSASHNSEHIVRPPPGSCLGHSPQTTWNCGALKRESVPSRNENAASFWKLGGRDAHTKEQAWTLRFMDLACYR